ncbi:radical SAM protein [Desulfobacula toluolica]|uniref:Radical SAM domain protein n=1 Tax=Desulfobacula toluolica (strain DSM 7467 / Tol2) TaxID=651182 RepID=K0NIR5_DESTT|nr:radical SAM protein [Desulfobacula toluolica]CCK79703.1 radical SAM domain protein [Desulfobacula toluolica Tol2]
MNSKTVFGPVPSRRLGKSVGINNIPPKICTYSCVYCQLGKTQKMIVYRCVFHDPDRLVEETKTKLINAQSNNESIDYLTIVSDGEPTLDAKLGLLIDRLRPLGIKIAVITNSSLLHRIDVRHDLCKADWVSVKIDTLDEKTWRKIDRPHNGIKFDVMLDGISSFAKKFTGRLVTETMLIKGLNDDRQNIEKTADFILGIDCATAYLSIPTRPPAQKWVKPPGEQALNQAYHVFDDRGINTEYLIGYEGNQFAFTGNIEDDILSITSVHPMRKDAVAGYLKKAGSDFSVIEKLLEENKLKVSEYQNEQFYIRKLPVI